jgi:hypothetical protein
MIDIESVVFTEISNAVAKSFPDAKVQGEYVETPETYPYISFVESDNYVNTATRTLNKIENHVNLMYECNIYTNQEGTKKSQAKAIAKVIDETMATLGFTRTFCNPIPNINRTIYRMVIRWQAIVSDGVEDKNGNTVHKIYSK